MNLDQQPHLYPKKVKPVWTDTVLGVAVLLTVDALAIFDAFAMGYLLRFQWGLDWGEAHTAASPVEYAKAWVFGTVVILALLQAYGLYSRAQHRDKLDLLIVVLKAVSFGVLFTLALSYFYRGFSYSRLSVVYSAVAAILLVGCFRVYWELYRDSLRRRGIAKVPTLLVGNQQISSFLAKKMTEDSSFGFHLVGIVDAEAEEMANEFDVPHCTLGEIDLMIERTGATEVLVGSVGLGHYPLLELISICEIRAVKIRIVPATYDLVINPHDFHEIAGVPLVTVNEKRIRPVGLAIKRAMDVLGSLLGILLVAPLVILAACLIRCETKGSVIFRQRRIGKDGKAFEILKLRSMAADAESRLSEVVDIENLAEPVFKIDSDPRVTRVGRFLRRWSIDELPQLLNVLHGKMSLVGPRPEEEGIVARYNVWERRRLKLKPGLTGWQQVCCRGSSSLSERVNWDVLYIRKQSLLLDCWILLKTVTTVISGKGAK